MREREKKYFGSVSFGKFSEIWEWKNLKNKYRKTEGEAFVLVSDTCTISESVMLKSVVLNLNRKMAKKQTTSSRQCIHIAANIMLEKEHYNSA